MSNPDFEIRYVLVTPKAYIQKLRVRKATAEDEINDAIELDDPGADWLELKKESFEARVIAGFRVKDST